MLVPWGCPDSSHLAETQPQVPSSHTLGLGVFLSYKNPQAHYELSISSLVVYFIKVDFIHVVVGVLHLQPGVHGLGDTVVPVYV